ncbi:MAG TPA: serine/threonine-protein kinase [Xanthomonadales bacterium]|nr:serine/threonine-protein kinase [Xanthomonadales bacterium]
MSTDPRAQRWAQVSSWFDQLIDLSAAAQELALAELAKRDAELAAEVRAMLIADARTQGVLEQREEVLAPVAAQANPEFGPSWRVQHLLGRGGMGEVWLAQRHQGDVVQTAAVKLLKRGMDSEALLQRFLQERRILAKLNHPAIASLLDAGVTPDGRPYLAMDYICGEPLTTFARAQGLGLEARLRLLAEVARVVDYAHRQLIVHRDLKPSNVLVDADGHPHLLDFGIAKVLGDDTDELVLTATGVRVLSPAYAAPEQVRGEEVGVAADVYGLGVLLYQLTAGRLPHRRSGRMEMLAQEVTGERATRPSVAAAELENSTELPALTERVGWSRRLRGDLDTLILKAIHPEAERRYASAAALAEDIDRFLAGRPIRARPDSRGYRMHKFIRRHRLGVIAASIALAGLLAGLALALWQAERAQLAARAAEEARVQVEREFARSEATKDFLVRSLDLAGLYQSGRRLSVDDLMLAMAERVDTELAEQPSAQGELRVVIGQSLLELGQPERGLALAERGRAQLAALNPQPTPLMAKVLTKIAILKRKSGDYPGAEAAVLESMAILDRLPGDQRLSRLENRTVLDYVLALRGNWPAALANGEARLVERMELLGGDDPGLAVDYNNVAVAYARMDRYADALAAYARCEELLVAGGLADSARMAGVERGRATLFGRLGKFDVAQAALARADQLRRRNLPPEHPDQRDTALGSAVLARLSGDAQRSQQRLSELLSSSPETDPRRGDYRYELARSEIALGRWAQALPLLLQAAEELERTAGGAHPYAIHARALAAYAQWRLGAAAPAIGRQLDEYSATMDKLGLGELDEAAEIVLMRAGLTAAQGEETKARELQARALRRYGELGVAAPEWLGAKAGS